jgi:hypothetical protein
MTGNSLTDHCRTSFEEWDKTFSLSIGGKKGAFAVVEGTDSKIAG